MAAPTLALLAALLGWLGARVLLGYPRRPPGLTWLSGREHAVVAAAASAVFPPGGAVAPSGRDARVPEHVDRFLGAQARPNRILMRLLFLLVEQATLVFPAPGRGGRRRFSALDPGQRVAYLRGWEASAVLARRLVFASLRAILTMAYFASPAVLEAVGLATAAVPPPERGDRA